jgi:hypothetical protein
MSKLTDQVRDLAQPYLCAKENQGRAKRVGRLQRAVGWIERHFRACRGLDQIGRKQVWSFYEAHGHLAPKTLAEYGYAFRLLWELLRRPGEPPWPKACE